jgi:hypothetical protein
MRTVLAAAFVIVCLAFGCAQAQAADAHLAKAVLQGCLASPSEERTAKLAAALSAKPYSAIRTRRGFGDVVEHFHPDASRPGESQRTRVKVTAFRGWDLPGPGAGTIEYVESRTEIDWIERVSGQATTPLRVAVDRSCRVNAPVASARRIFELYQTLHSDPVGLLVSPDRRQIVAFRFDPDRFDIELGFGLAAPLPGLAPSKKDSGMERVVVADDDGQFLNGVPQGVDRVTITRSALLTGLEQQAAMTFGNTVIEPVVQRLTAAGDQGRRTP